MGHHVCRAIVPTDPRSGRSPVPSDWIGDSCWRRVSYPPAQWSRAVLGADSCFWCWLGQSAVSLQPALSASLFILLCSSSNCELMGGCCVRDEATGALLTARDQVSLSWAQATATDCDKQLQSGIAAACRSTPPKLFASLPLMHLYPFSDTAFTEFQTTLLKCSTA